MNSKYVKSSKCKQRNEIKLRDKRIAKKTAFQSDVEVMPNDLISAGSKLRIARPLAAERPGHHRDANPGREVASFLEQGSHVI